MQFRNPKLQSPMQHSVTVIVPGTIDITESASVDIVNLTVAYVSHTLADWFGGCTVTSGDGGYIADSGGYITEPVQLCTAFCSEECLLQHEDDVVNLACWICAAMSQECIGLVIDNQFHLIS